MDANPEPESTEVDDDVSIHAPVMDANIPKFSGGGGGYVSIHAPVMDAKQALHKLAVYRLFQSTRP